MKRFALIALICAFVMGATSSAFATDLVVKGGDLRVVGQWFDNKDFDENEAEDTFKAYERMRVAFQFVASENLRADVEIAFADGDFGDDFRIGNTYSVNTRKAYLTFDVPGTEATVKAGYQGFAVPSATGYMSILDARVGGVVIGTPFTDAVGMNLGWFRTEDSNDGEDTPTYDDSNKDDVDLIYASLPINCDGYSITPWGMYAFIGDDTSYGIEDGSAYWLGAGATIDMFDPIVVMADFQYGALKADDDADETKGWLFDLAVDYKMDMFTPELFFAYASGSDDEYDATADERTDAAGNLPIIDGDTYYTTFMLDGSAISSGDYIGMDDGAEFVNGLWAIGFKLKDISFMEGLTHTATIFYAKGTNDEKSGMDFTEEDSFIEVNFDSQYQIYEQLAAIVEMGYAQLDMDEDVHGDDYLDDAAYKLAVGLKYSF
jgi:hypothetical protein